MHSAVYCFTIKPEEEISIDIEDIVRDVELADYAVKIDPEEDSENYEDYKKWFEDIYGIEIGKEGSIDIEKFFEAIKKEMKESLAKAQKEIEKVDAENIRSLDLYRISEILYPRSGFMFGLDESIMNSVSFYDELKYLIQEGAEKIYLKEIFDYHF